MSFSYPKVYAINLKGIFLVSEGSFWRKEPDAAFLGLANLSGNFLKSEFLIKTSPLISISFGKFFYFISLGISFIVLRFSVISSPSLPSPLDNPVMNLPFL